MAQADSVPIYLTAEGRRRLEQRLAAYEAEFRERGADGGGAEAEDSAEEATDLEASDDRLRLGDLIADLRRTLDRARPLLPRPDDGVIRQGDTVRVRDEAQREEEYRLVDGAEVDLAEGQVAIDSPVGRALLGRQPGERVAVRTPDGERMLTVLSVQPYRAPAT
jgi:transcription elongation GreA/GreB family factor